MTCRGAGSGVAVEALRQWKTWLNFLQRVLRWGFFVGSGVGGLVVRGRRCVAGMREIALTSKFRVSSPTTCVTGPGLLPWVLLPGGGDAGR